MADKGVTKEAYDLGLNCRGICCICTEMNICYQYEILNKGKLVEEVKHTDEVTPLSVVVSDMEVRYIDCLFAICTENRLSDEETFNSDIARLHTKEMLEKICDKKLTDKESSKALAEITNLWVSEFSSFRLWAYCCGTLIFRPVWHDKENIISSLMDKEFEVIEKLSSGCMNE